MTSDGRGGSAHIAPPLTKAQLRLTAKAARAAARQAAGTATPDGFITQFLARVPVRPGAVVSGYFPIGDELDVRPLLARLAAIGHACALPVVDARDRPLGFRHWLPGQPTIPGPFRVPEPLPTAAAIEPSVVIVPLLAFDRRGHRLGYGAGFYDRTLASLRAGGAVLAVGAAFATQEVDAIPVGPEDQPLDWIVTDRHASPLPR